MLDETDEGRGERKEEIREWGKWRGSGRSGEWEERGRMAERGKKGEGGRMEVRRGGRERKCEEEREEGIAEWEKGEEG